MKSTGIVRKLDELGRITLPIELRRNLNIGERDPLEIFVDDERIILKKYEPCDLSLIHIYFKYPISIKHDSLIMHPCVCC